MTKTILILAANPKDKSRLRLDQEVREIHNGLERSKKRDEFILKQIWAVRRTDLRRTMLDLKPSIVHFCGHGSEKDGIAFEDDNGQTEFVSTDALSRFFELFADTVECVILNACYSEAQAVAIAEHIPNVIGMQKAIGDTAAIEFAVAFYDALGAGEPVEFAYKLACNAIQQLPGVPEHLTPILKININKPAPEGNKPKETRRNTLELKQRDAAYNPVLGIDLTSGQLLFLLGIAFTIYISLQLVGIYYYPPLRSVLPTATIFLGFAGLSFNYFAAKKMINAGRNRQEYALKELSERIRWRIEEKELLSPNAVRSLAYAIEKKYKSTLLTDKLICEAIRQAALDVEELYEGKELTSQIEVLNSILLKIDAESIPLLSVSETVDRLSAFSISQIFNIVIIFAILIYVSLSQFSQNNILKMVLFASISSLLLILYVWFFITITRARMFWDNAPPGEIHNKSSDPQKENVSIFDLFLSSTMSRQKWASVFWFILTSIMETLGSILFQSPFLERHNRRVDYETELNRQLGQLKREIVIKKIKGHSVSKVDTERLKGIYQRLWVVTGNEQYKENELAFLDKIL